MYIWSNTPNEALITNLCKNVVHYSRDWYITIHDAQDKGIVLIGKCDRSVRSELEIKFSLNRFDLLYGVLCIIITDLITKPDISKLLSIPIQTLEMIINIDTDEQRRYAISMYHVAVFFDRISHQDPICETFVPKIELGETK